MAGYLQHIKDMNENISEDAIEELRNMNNIVRAAFESAIRAIEFDDTKEAKEALSYAEDVYCYKKDHQKETYSENERWSLFSRYWCIFP